MDVADIPFFALHLQGNCFFLHYLDDFLLFGPPGTYEALRARQTAEATFSFIGAPISTEKKTGSPSQVWFSGDTF